MPNRREFLRSMASASAGACLVARDLVSATPRASQGGTATPKRRQVSIGGRRVQTVDMHCHCTVPEIADVIKGTKLESRLGGLQGGGAGGFDTSVGAKRLQKMDEEGIDVQAMSINSFWYGVDRDLAHRLIDVQNEKLGQMCKAYPGRLVAFASVALQFPDLAAQQLEDGVKHLGLCGAAIGPSMEGGEELSSTRFDPFWAKAEEMQALIFVHPQDSATSTGVRARVQGNGVLGNVIGNPLETTIFLSHMIFEGTLDRFPNLKLCLAHGGGYLPSYADRMDHGCLVFPEQCKKPIKKHPTEYLKQLYFDSILFTPEALRHLVAVVGPSQIVLGTDYPFPWSETPVDHLLATPGLTDAERVAILGGNARKLLRLAS